jgi:hypothetical protein
MPSESTDLLDDRWLGFASGQWLEVDKATAPETLKAKKDATGKIYYTAQLGARGSACTGQPVYSGSGVIFDEMVAVNLKPVAVEPDPSKIKYPLFVDLFEEDEEYELAGEVGVEQVDGKTFISVTTNTPLTSFTLVAREKSSKQIRWNSRTGADGYKRISTPRNLTGYAIRLVVDGDVLDESRVP